MFVDFFIKRPIFATVCALLIILCGAICIPILPIAQYPSIAPPKVNVTSAYVGADAQVVESSVTSLLEQQINGVTGVKYLTSTSGNDGTSSIDIVFDLERDIDLAAVDVQSRVNAVQGRLPDEVKRTGVTVQKVSTDFVLAIGIGCPDGRYNTEFLSNYADVYIKDALKRVKGVGDVIIFGERKYSMRVWLDPHKMAENKLSATDVISAITEQNVQVAAGQIGQEPAPKGHLYQMSVRADGRLRTAAQFEDIVLRTGQDGSITRLKDVGRAELGAETYTSVVRYKGQEALGIGVMQRPGSNALEVAKGVRAEMARIAKRLPPGIGFEYAFDTTLAVSESIDEVLKTLAQAIVLVVIVMYLFLQNARATFIPAITIPVSLIGTFACMKALGFSINTLTLFGITLATGLVVDDAIVVIENISRFIHEKRMNARVASSMAMGEVTGAVIAISLVLIAVFVPVSFFPGTTGMLYRQFALTIACSVAISTFNALTLTPALCALWLQEHEEKESIIFKPVNWVLNKTRYYYAKSLRVVIRWTPVALALFVGTLFATSWLFKIVPSGFIPNEDQGWFITMIQGPEGVSLNYTMNVLKQVEHVYEQQPEIAGSFGVAGFSFSGTKPNNALVFANLKPWAKRPGKDQTLDGIINRVRGPLSKISGAAVIPFNPPAIQGLGNFGGFVFELEDTRGGAIGDLGTITSNVVRKANANSDLRGVFSSFSANTPQLSVSVDRDKSKAMNVPLSEIYTALQVFLGSLYVNDIDLGTRVYRVYAQADQQFRSNPKDLTEYYVRSLNQQMVPLGNLITLKNTTAPQSINHYNLFRSTEIIGSPAPGISSGQAMKSMEKATEGVLPDGMTFEWSGISLEQVEAGEKSIVIFTLGILFVFLVLAAQYESFTDPVIILLAVPGAVMGALSAQWLRGLQNDVFCQIGLVMLIGLVSKNAILIVEFANQLRDKGMPALEAAIQASEIRLRPILMTTFAFVMGILPLVFAAGAGAASRQSLGTAVCGGMLVSSILTLYTVPVIYVAADALFRRPRKISPGFAATNSAEEESSLETFEQRERDPRLP